MYDECRKKALYAECCYAECLYAECHNAERHDAKLKNECKYGQIKIIFPSCLPPCLYYLM